MSLPIASPYRRLSAGLIDALVVLIAIGVMINNYYEAFHAFFIERQPFTWTVLWIFLVPFLFPLFIELATWGRSIGKAIFGLRVVSINRRKLGLFQIIIRYLVFWIEGLITVGALALWFSFNNKKGQRLGDKLASTTVISER